MDRRTVIKNLALVIGGATLLPSCLKGSGNYIPLKHINITADQEKLVSDICETIIPKTDVPGARELNLHIFVLKMLDDCYKKKDQQAIMKGMDEFNAMVQKKYSKSFSDLDAKGREAVLTGIENGNKPKTGGNKPPARRFRPQKDLQVPPLDAFYWALKQQTIFAYTTSQFFMTKEIVYELVPGRYNAHFPVKNLKTA
ncbi:MAG TPA: gluconate 2-dehydrogenase subunit 3 family protein [Mucilaginibacter sp.]|jgi:hypothetical protein|nr:gluconate 2-dehydrogenase subunit 3 family protein [Mucilaginibacter sp.]